MEQNLDSYVTLAEADLYATSIYPETKWGSLAAEERELRLVLACEQLEALPFVGRKRRNGQPLAFPRHPESTVPSSIKTAQMELALLPLREDAASTQADAAQRVSLQRQGVTSFSLGDLSESYGASAGLSADFPFLLDAKISGLLRRFLSGGYPVC